jgi:hypothetical protein
MPIQTIQDDAGRTLYRWGDTGKLYRTRKSALKQGRAIKARQEADRIYKAQQERRQLYRQAKRMDLEELEAFWQLRQELKAEKESSRELDYTAEDQITDRGIQRLLKKARRQLRLEQGMKVSPELPDELEEPTTSKSGIRTKAKRGRPIKSIYRRDDLTAREAQKRRRKGAVVNETIPRPKPPCKGLDEEKCEVCGEFVKEVKLGANDVQAASQLIRRSAGGWAAGGGYRSRGPLLWAMHVNKLERFYLRHLEHCELQFMYQEETGSIFVPLPPSIVWAESFGDELESQLAQLFQQQLAAEEEDEPFRDWRSQPMAPAEYSPQMTITLLRLRELLDSQQEKNRKKLGLPSRREAGDLWDEEANKLLAPADLYDFGPPKGEFPF